MRFGNGKETAEALVVTVTVGAVLLFAVWRLAQPPAEPGMDELQEQVRFLEVELETVRDRLRRTEARESVLERETEVLRRANRLLRDGESDRQAERNRLQSELDFYRRLSGTGGSQDGLDVYRIEINPTDSSRVFRFIMTLTQNMRRASITNGRARIDVEGVLNDRPVTLPWSDVSDGDSPEPAFRFKYFQQLEGYLTLPEGFSPTRLAVSLEASGQRRPLLRHFDWGDMLEPAAD
jgi:hypothetical protein